MKKMNQYTHKADKGYPCPKCGKYLDAATHESGAEPGPGDFSICAECSSLLRFEEPMPKTRLATDADWAELDEDDRASIKEMQAKREEFLEATRPVDLFMKHFGET